MANPRRPTKVPPAEVHVESVFGEGRSENKAESEADGAWVIMQKARDMWWVSRYLQACQEQGTEQ